MNKIFDIFKGDNNQFSSKRFVGVIGAFILFASMVYYNTDKLVEAVQWVVILALGFTTVDKFTKDGKQI